MDLRTKADKGFLMGPTFCEQLEWRCSGSMFEEKPSKSIGKALLGKLSTAGILEVLQPDGNGGEFLGKCIQ